MIAIKIKVFILKPIHCFIPPDLQRFSSRSRFFEDFDPKKTVDGNVPAVRKKQQADQN